MNRVLKSISLTLLISVLFSSCGVIFGGSKYYATIEAKDHPNAKIYANGQKVGTGKAMYLLPRDQNLQIRLEEEGCPSQTKTYYKTFRGGNFVLSLLTWGLVGVIVDVASGASFKPDHINQPEVFKATTKKFVFLVNYDNCDGSEASQSKGEGEFDYAR